MTTIDLAATRPGLVFGIQAPLWNEMITALRPHISHEETRPALQMVRVRFTDGQIAFDATDGYSALRATVMADDALIGQALPDLDVLVPGDTFTALKPAKDQRVDFTLVRPDMWAPDDNGEMTLVEAGVSEITDHTTTIRLEHPPFDARSFPDLDATLAGRRRPEGERGLRISPVQLAKLAKLPKAPFATVFLGWRQPIMFAGSGIAIAETSGMAHYQGAFMPIYTGDDVDAHEVVTDAMWDCWAA